MDELTSSGDQNFAIRDALNRAIKKTESEVYGWSPERTALAYQALCDGFLVVDLVATGFGERLFNTQTLEPKDFEPGCFVREDLIDRMHS